MDEDKLYLHFRVVLYNFPLGVPRGKERKDQTSCKARMAFISGGPFYDTQFLYNSCSHLALPRNAS